MANLRQSWSSLPVELTEAYLRIGGHDVMQAWERPLMEAMARGVTRSRGDVLEIGYGMGISAGAIIRFGCRSYTVIEANREVASKARRCGLGVIEGFWEDVVPALADESFDGIFFDVFPLRGADTDHRPMFAATSRLLRPGGVLTYFAGQTMMIPTVELEALMKHYSGIEIGKVAGMNPPADCEYPHGETMLTVFATK